MNELHLFAGAGGGILAGQMLGHRCIGAVEWEPYAQAVLVARQNDGSLPPFPIWDDVRTFDGRPWAGAVDIVAGGFPCQDISVAGKGAGIEGARSGMWTHMARIVSEIRPQFVFVENSPALITRGLGVVLSDMAALGYDCRWTVLGAADVGAPHQRDRLWILAERSDVFQHTEHGRTERRKQQPCSDEKACCCNLADPNSIASQIRGPNWADEKTCGGRGCHRGGGDDFREPSASTDEAMADPNSLRQPQPQRSERDERRRPCDGCGYVFDHIGRYVAEIGDSAWWATERGLDRVANGVAHRTHRLKAIGNGQVPQCAAAAFRMLLKSFD